MKLQLLQARTAYKTKKGKLLYRYRNKEVKYGIPGEQELERVTFATPTLCPQRCQGPAFVEEAQSSSCSTLVESRFLEGQTEIARPADFPLTGPVRLFPTWTVAEASRANSLWRLARFRGQGQLPLRPLVFIARGGRSSWVTLVSQGSFYSFYHKYDQAVLFM